MTCPPGSRMPPGECRPSGVPRGLSFSVGAYTACWLLVTLCPFPGPSAVAIRQHSSLHISVPKHTRNMCWVGAEGGWAGPRAPESGKGRSKTCPKQAVGGRNLYDPSFQAPSHGPWFHQAAFTEDKVKDQNNNYKRKTMEF